MMTMEKKAGRYLAHMELEFFIFSGTEQLSINLQGKDTTVFIVGQYRASGQIFEETLARYTVVCLRSSIHKTLEASQACSQNSQKGGLFSKQNNNVVTLQINLRKIDTVRSRFNPRNVFTLQFVYLVRYTIVYEDGWCVENEV